MKFLEKVEQSGKWPQQACTTMFFLIPKNVASERPLALKSTLIRWWEVIRSPDVAKWQQRCRADRDATDGSSGPGAGPREGLPTGVGLSDAFQLPKEDLAGALWILRAPEASAV